MENIKIKDLSEINIYNSNEKNIASIAKDGLIPKIGDSATGIE